MNYLKAGLKGLEHIAYFLNFERNDILKLPREMGYIWNEHIMILHELSFKDKTFMKQV